MKKTISQIIHYARSAVSWPGSGGERPKWRLLGRSFFIFAACTMLPAAASADIGNYNFERSIGSVYVKTVTVESGTFQFQRRGWSSPDYHPDYVEWSRGVELRLSAVIPSCPNQYHTEGRLIVRYKNGAASITRVAEVGKDDEGQAISPKWIIEGYYGIPANGTVNVESSIVCKYHGVNGRGGPQWAPWNW